MFRGYTCGLWTTFHALTVHTYIDTIKDEQVDALKPLKDIQVKGDGRGEDKEFGLGMGQGILRLSTL